MTILHAKNQFKVAKYDKSYTCCEVTAYWLRQVAVSWTSWVPVQVGNGIELDTVGLQFEPYQWLL